MENKEVIEKLTEFYLKQSDFPTIARALSAAMIDYSRFVNVDKLDEEERNSLYARSFLNAKELQRFVKDGWKGEKFILRNVPEKERE